MSHYDEVLKEARAKASGSAKEYIPKLFHILVDEEGRKPEEARAIIEHDLISYWAKTTVSKYLPQEAKDEIKAKAGKEGAEKKKIMLLADGSRADKILAEPQTVTTKSDSSESVSPEGNDNDDEDPKDTEIQFLKEQVAELQDALKKTDQFKPATQLQEQPPAKDPNPTPELQLTDDLVFQYLRDRAKETGNILIIDRVGAGALVQALSQYKNSFGVAELFLRIIK
jgi:hypothetical protein